MSNKRVARSVVAGVSVLTAGSVIGLAATQPQSVATGLIDLTALIVVGSSTNPTGDGVEHFYFDKYNDGRPIVRVGFPSGPAGIRDALTGDDDIVLASGWGASNASHVLVTNPDDPDVQAALWVLDNNLNIPNGGFATRYPLFSRLVFIDPTPTPTSTDPNAPIVITTRYKYDINSDAPAIPLNVVAMANTLAAYFQTRLNQDNVEMPVRDDGIPDENECTTPCTVTPIPGKPNEWTVTWENTETVAYVKKVDNVTYVSYDTPGLPLVEPFRMLPGGNIFADAIEPAATAVVNYGYPNNDPLGDPNADEPARLFPTAQETATFLGNFQQGVQDGVQSLGGITTLTTPNDTLASTESEGPKPLPKPLTQIVRTSPMFMPGTTSGASGSSGTGGPKPGGVITGAVKAVSDAVKGTLPGGKSATGDSTASSGAPAG